MSRNDDRFWEQPVTIDLRLAMDLYQCLGHIENWPPHVLSAADRITDAMNALPNWEPATARPTGDVARGWTFFWYVGGFIAGAMTSRWAKS